MSAKRASLRLLGLLSGDTQHLSWAAGRAASSVACSSPAQSLSSSLAHPAQALPCSSAYTLRWGGFRAQHSAACSLPVAPSSSAQQLHISVPAAPLLGMGLARCSQFRHTQLQSTVLFSSRHSASTNQMQLRGLANVKEAAVKAAARLAANRGKAAENQNPHRVRIRRFVLCIAGMCYSIWLLKDLVMGPKLTEHVYMDLAVDGQKVGRLVIGLYGKTQPATVENFVGLVTHYKGIGYTGCPFHCIVKDQALLGGDITAGDGRGGASMHGVFFGVESKFMIPDRGSVGMVMDSIDRDCIGSQFYILAHTNAAVHKQCAVIGKVVKGLPLVDALVRMPVDSMQRPFVRITIESCGKLSKEEVEAELRTKTSSPLLEERMDGSLHPQPIPATFGSLR